MSEDNQSQVTEKKRPYSWLAVVSFVVALMPFFLAIWLNISDRIAYVLSICGAVFAVVVGIWMIRTQQRGGGFVIVAFLLCVLPLMILPPLGRARDLSNRANCASRLQGIGRAIQAYQADYNGLNPPTLETLIELDIILPDILICLGSEEQPGESSYIYRGDDLTDNVTGDMILAYEKPGHHGDLLNVLYSDGRVMEYDESKFWYLIENDNKLRKKQGFTEKPMEITPRFDREGREIVTTP